MVRYFIVNSSSGGLDGAVHIADRLEQYEIFPKIKTGEDMGHFLVDTAPYLNQLVPMHIPDREPRLHGVLAPPCRKGAPLFHEQF